VYVPAPVHVLAYVVEELGEGLPRLLEQCAWSGGESVD
jgi:hypothetical protein